MNNSSPLISIITVVFNGVDTLEQTMESVMSQTYKNVEYIIVDGGSTDGTIDIIKKYKDKLAYWVSESDKGIYNAMNKGIDKCNGELIGIVNSDDYYEPNTVEIVVNRYNSENKKEGVYYGFLKLWKDGKEHAIRRFHHNFPKDHMIQHPTWFVSKSIYEKFGKFDDSYKIAGDFELFQRLVKHNVEFFPIDAILSNFRIGGISSYAGRLGAMEYLDLKYKLGWYNRKKYNLLKLKMKIEQIFVKKPILS
ncbi:MAG: glycosyltransferase [Flavobacteriaceae bacterium]|jgi:glycosyltransferase involved in cell wall biosynthesis|nr:glycosyltransferase [Flavobacteriaceae bacterium]